MKNIKYISYYENSGYAIAAKMYIKALLKSGVNITWHPVKYGGFLKRGYHFYNGPITWEEPFQQIRKNVVEYEAVIIHTVPELYPYWIERERGKYLIGYTVWETTKPPDHWPDLINQLDHLIVPTEWNKKIFKKYGVTIPIDVIPHLSEFNGEEFNQLQNHQGKNPFLFYTISTWTERKALWKIIDAYTSAFTQKDNVELLIKTSMIDTTRPKFFIRRLMKKRYQSVRKTFDQYLKGKNNLPAITLVDDDTLPQEYIHQLHSRGDCYVSLCRSEGWGIGAFEAAMFGKPVIMTGFGGQTDFLPADKSHLIDYKLIPVFDKQAPQSYNITQKWAEPDIRHAADKLKEVFQNQSIAKKMGEELKKDVRLKFDNEKTTQKFVQLLNRIRHR